MVTAPPRSFRNGEAPLEWFHVLRSGRYSGSIPQGEVAGWAQLLTPAMLDFHNRLVARAYRRTGRTLALSTGYSAYRPIGDQRRAKRLYGRGAAAEGFSSHGLWFEGAYSAAFDYGNWESVYAGKGGKAAFYADVRAEGGIAGYFDRDERPGTVHEPWHVIIRDPFRLGVASNPQYAGGSSTFDPEEDDVEQIEKDKIDQIYKAVVKSYGSELEAIVNILRKELMPVITAIRNGDIRYLGTNWNAFETLVNVVREDDGRDMSVPDVDEAAIAAALAPSLAPLLADHLGTLTDETLDEIAKRAADEQARRLAS